MTTANEPTDCYEDGILPDGHPIREQAERAYRSAYLAAANQAALWDEPDIEAVEAARHARADARFAAIVGIEQGCYHYAADHAVAAARTRGRHHALEFACQAWERDDAEPHDTPTVLQRWLAEVIRWAEGPRDEISLPPNTDDDRPRSTEPE
jgi:hypothetical protein